MITISELETLSISLKGKELKYEIINLDIFSIHFYTKNPRIASIISSQKGDINDNAIHKILWDRDPTHRLCQQIQKDGGLIHPILVYNNEVLEGNTRLCCYRHLFSQTQDSKWNKIKCQVITNSLTQEDIYRLLCTEHIEGKIEWEAYEKANLYVKMKEEEGMTDKQISEIVGESQPIVGYRIRAYKMMKDNGVEEKNKYSHFDQFVRIKSECEQYNKTDKDFDHKIVQLIKEDKIPKATDIRKIPDICKDKVAKKRLLEQKEELPQVYHDLKAKSPMIDSSLMNEVEGLIKKLRNMSRAERDDLKKGNRECRKIEELIKELLYLANEMNMKVHVPNKMKKGN